MIKINGFSLLDYGITVDFKSSEIITPEIRTNFAERGAYGSINYGTTHGNIVFSMACTVQGNIRYNIRELVKLLIDENGAYKEVRLDLGTIEGKYYNVMLTDPIELNPLAPKVGQFNLEFTATDPFAKSIYATEKYFESVNAATKELEIPITYYGTERTSFDISMFGKVGNFTIQVYEGSKVKQTFKYRSAMHDSFYILDFNTFKIDDNGNNGLLNASGDFLYINRLTTKIIIKGELSGSVNFKYREQYV